MERLRQTHAKEVESRDEEVEEIRQSCQKKVGLGCGPLPVRGQDVSLCPGRVPGAASWALSRSARLPRGQPQPSSTGLAGLTGPSTALAGVRRPLRLSFHQHPAGGVTQRPQYVGTGGPGPFPCPDWVARAVPS